MPMSPAAYYQQALTEQGFTPDAQQAAVVSKLQKLYEHISAKKPSILNGLRRRTQSIQGLYLWGSVGAGKTWLMDIFYQSLPGQRKLRRHFHHFMQDIHRGLGELAGQADPLRKLAQRYAKQYDVICFDEFVVNDITDAMLLGNLLEALFQQGVNFMATSNLPPDELYRNGLARERFLPAIAWLKKSTEVVELVSQVDYRLRVLEQAGVYYTPLDAEAAAQMQTRFQQLTGGVYDQQPLVIAGRAIPVFGLGSDVVWFSFNGLCHVPRSQTDYLAIAQNFHTVLLSDVPQIAAEHDDSICYLIQLVDVFYDANIKLIISAAVPIAEIYPEGRYHFAFKRTSSRLQEMQSHAYLSRTQIS